MQPSWMPFWRRLLCPALDSLPVSIRIAELAALAAPSFMPQSTSAAIRPVGAVCEVLKFRFGGIETSIMPEGPFDPTFEPLRTESGVAPAGGHNPSTPIAAKPRSSWKALSLKCHAILIAAVSWFSRGSSMASS